jgi:LVIVD repeat-containing protein
VARAIYTNLARASDVEIVGNRAYIAADTDGLVILDIGNPDSPKPLGSTRAVEHAYFVHVVGDLAYVTDYYRGIRIIDVRNPADPVVLAQYDYPGRVAVEGDRLYVASDGAGLHIARVHPDRLPARATLAQAGGMLTTIDGGISLAIPAGALAGSATLTITPALNTAPPIPQAHVLRAAALEARAGDGQALARLDQPYILTISYTDAQLAARSLREADLRLVYWDGAAWVPLACAGCGVDTVANRAIVTLDRVTTVALVGDPPLSVYLPLAVGR